MAPHSGGSPSSSSRRSKKSGVPTKDKLYKAIALVQSQAKSDSGTPRSLETRSKATTSHVPSNDRVRQPLSPSQQSDSQSPKKESFFFSAFSSRASTSITRGNEAVNQENQPTPRSRSSRQVSPQAVSLALQKVQKHHAPATPTSHRLKVDPPPPSSSKTGTSSQAMSSNLTPRSSVALATEAEQKRIQAWKEQTEALAKLAKKKKARKSSRKESSSLRKQQLSSSKISSSRRHKQLQQQQQKPQTSPRQQVVEQTHMPQPPVSPRHQIRQLLQQTSSEEILDSVAPSMASSKTAKSTKSRRVSSAGRYNRALNHKSTQEDVAAAQKFSTAIEEDIAATSLSLSKIAEFIDKVASPKKSKRNNTAYYYKKRYDDVKSYDDFSDALRSEDDSYVLDAREPEATHPSENDGRQSVTSTTDIDLTTSASGASKSVMSRQQQSKVFKLTVDTQLHDSSITPTRHAPASAPTALQTKHHTKESKWDNSGKMMIPVAQIDKGVEPVEIRGQRQSATARPHSTKFGAELAAAAMDALQSQQELVKPEESLVSKRAKENSKHTENLKQKEFLSVESRQPSSSSDLKVCLEAAAAALDKIGNKSRKESVGSMKGNNDNRSLSEDKKGSMSLDGVKTDDHQAKNRTQVLSSPPGTNLSRDGEESNGSHKTEQEHALVDEKDDKLDGIAASLQQNQDPSNSETESKNQRSAANRLGQSESVLTTTRSQDPPDAHTRKNNIEYSQSNARLKNSGRGQGPPEPSAMKPSSNENDERSHKSGSQSTSAQSQDPPEDESVPQRMGSKDELQEKQEVGVSFDSQDSSIITLDETALRNSRDPDVLLKISAFIDRVERKAGRKAKGSGAVRAPSLDPFEFTSISQDLDASALANLFDKPLLTPSTAEKQSVVDKESKWLDMEKLIGYIADDPSSGQSSQGGSLQNGEKQLFKDSETAIIEQSTLNTKAKLGSLSNCLLHSATTASVWLQSSRSGEDPPTQDVEGESSYDLVKELQKLIDSREDPSTTIKGIVGTKRTPYNSNRTEAKLDPSPRHTAKAKDYFPDKSSEKNNDRNRDPSPQRTLDKSDASNRGNATLSTDFEGSTIADKAGIRVLAVISAEDEYERMEAGSGQINMISLDKKSGAEVAPIYVEGETDALFVDLTAVNSDDICKEEQRSRDGSEDFIDQDKSDGKAKITSHNAPTIDVSSREEVDTWRQEDLDCASQNTALMELLSLGEDVANSPRKASLEQILSVDSDESDRNVDLASSDKAEIKERTAFTFSSAPVALSVGRKEKTVVDPPDSQDARKNPECVEGIPRKSSHGRAGTYQENHPHAEASVSSNASKLGQQAVAAFEDKGNDALKLDGDGLEGDAQSNKLQPPGAYSGSFDSSSDGSLHLDTEKEAEVIEHSVNNTTEATTSENIGNQTSETEEAILACVGPIEMVVSEGGIRVDIQSSVSGEREIAETHLDSVESSESETLDEVETQEQSITTVDIAVSPVHSVASTSSIDVDDNGNQIDGPDDKEPSPSMNISTDVQFSEVPSLADDVGTNVIRLPEIGSISHDEDTGHKEPAQPFEIALQAYEETNKKEEKSLAETLAASEETEKLAEDAPPYRQEIVQIKSEAEKQNDEEEAGISLIQLTLNELKNLASGEVSNEKLAEIQQLDERVASLVSDADNGSGDAEMRMNGEAPTHLKGGVNQKKRNQQIAANGLAADSEASVSYDFQSSYSREQPGSLTEQEESFQSEETHLVNNQSLSIDSNVEKKGQKRKLSPRPSPTFVKTADSSNGHSGVGQTDSQSVPETLEGSNWLASLNQIINCRQPCELKSTMSGTQEIPYKRVPHYADYAHAILDPSESEQSGDETQSEDVVIVLSESSASAPPQAEKPKNEDDKDPALLPSLIKQDDQDYAERYVNNQSPSSSQKGPQGETPINMDPHCSPSNHYFSPSTIADHSQTERDPHVFDFGAISSSSSSSSSEQEDSSADTTVISTTVAAVASANAPVFYADANPDQDDHFNRPASSPGSAELAYDVPAIEARGPDGGVDLGEGAEKPERRSSQSSTSQEKNISGAMPGKLHEDVLSDEIALNTRIGKEFQSIHDDVPENGSGSVAQTHSNEDEIGAKEQALSSEDDSRNSDLDDKVNVAEMISEHDFQSSPNGRDNKDTPGHSHDNSDEAMEPDDLDDRKVGFLSNDDEQQEPDSCGGDEKTYESESTNVSEEDIPASGWAEFVDLTQLDDVEEEDLENAWEDPVGVSLISPRHEDNLLHERIMRVLSIQASRDDREQQGMVDAVMQKSWDDQTRRTGKSVKDDHASGFDIAEQMNECEKIVPGDEFGNVEVDFDTSFAKTSLAPSSEDVHSWYPDGQSSSLRSEEEGNRYTSIEGSAEEGDRHTFDKNRRLITILDEDEEDENRSFGLQQNSSQTSYIPPSSKEADSFHGNEEASHGLTSDNRSEVRSFSASTNHQGGDEDVLGKLVDLDPHHALSCQSLSYESDNDEWLRKRDLATRRTRDPSSWITRTASGIQSKLSFVTVETPKVINGTAAAKRLNLKVPKRRGGRRRNAIPSSKVWRRSYKERTKDHPGYFDVDLWSLLDTAAVGVSESHHLDAAPWESRDVRQHFLHEESISLSKNWFGKAQRTRGNDRVREPVAHPRSMDMPMESSPHPEDWTEEWYKTWKAPIDTRASRSVSSDSIGSASHVSYSKTNGSCSHSIAEASCNESTTTRGAGESVYTGSYASAHSSEDSFDDTPQCGELINVKPKIGERVTRIHPDFTSQLRRSRWRKKHFPRGTFPYDK